MPTPADQLSHSTDRLSQLKASLENHLGEVVANVRWLSTLVLAEMAGLAAYRKEAPNLAFIITLLIILLCVPLGLFIWTALTARSARRNIGKEFNRFQHSATPIPYADLIPSVAVKNISDEEVQASDALSQESDRTFWQESIGILSFGGLTIVIGILVLAYAAVDAVLRSFGFK